MYHNIPMELRVPKQWVCWRYELVNDRKTKVPYSANGQYKANINNPATWGTFDEAVQTSLSPSMDGIGFVLTEHDPYTGIDIDDKLENPATEAERAVHIKVLEAFQSYTERSVGGRGYHIIIRGKIKGGRDRGHIGIYSTQRYLTFSGDVVRNAPIAEYQTLLEQLVSEMPGNDFADQLHDVEGVLTDLELHEMAMNASNGDKYDQLCKGDWQSMGYTSQSEADLALLSILAFYSRDNEQVRRLFRYSNLGKRDKAVDDNKYIDRTLKLVRAKQAAPVDFEQAMRNASDMVRNGTQGQNDSAALLHVQHEAGAGVLPQLQSTPEILALVPPAPVTRAHTHAGAGSYTLPPGLVGELAQYFYSTAHRPVQEVALAAAIGVLAGVCGRSYNISGTGLNQYLLVLAKTGTGKESMESGINKLVQAVRKTIPMAEDFLGPSSFASGQGLIRVLDQRPCFVSVLGEFGLTLQSINDPRAPSNMVILRKVLLDLYGKSGWSAMLRSTAYSDTEKNTKMIHAPSVTIVGESTPETFYDGIDSGDIADGLIPRFQIIEYKGQRPDRNKQADHPPSPELTNKFADLVNIALTCQNNMSCAQVQIAPDALNLLDAFDRECDAHMRSSHHAGETQLWNRAHLKALKLAGLLAVGCNPHAPIVTVELARWAIEFTDRGTKQVLHRFNIGDVGTGEAKQSSEIRRVIEEYFKSDKKTLVGYKCKPEFKEHGVIPYSYFLARLLRVSCFYKDRNGAAKSIQNGLDTMIKADMLGQIGPLDAQNKFKTRQALYYIGESY